ncbi:dna helicase recq family member [Holotrichia oblita]|uniref:Dna helicase recq family member n=1 Tax=Holotrichia oblita TaxID=644536 RepID=A0ACB9TYG6_HOLOL|nr:dna helicase recq family member [Holotrichia oblita]
MAEESALAVRKSNKKLMKRGNNEENVDSDARVDGETCEDEFVEDSQDNDSDDDQLLAETLRLEELVAKLDTQAYIDSTNFVKPYYELTDDGNVIDTTKEVYDALKEFGYTQFRPGQEAAIMRILSGKSTLVTLSTGSGKSLCYQLPAYIYSKREPCIALVISPLVSLMEDQVTGLPPFLKAACLHTNQTKTQREKVMELVSAGSLSILLVSPEAVAAGERSTGFGSLLRKLPPISFACIDEAHCVSQWSHNFRPSYLMICRILRERLGVTTILGLTATATVSTANNIIEHLKVSDGSDGIISDIPLPHNLHLTVSKDSNRDNALVGLLLSERFAQCRSVIVYCTRREECERVARFLRSTLRDEKSEQAGGNTKKRKRMSEQAEPYHAGLSAKRRKSIQNSFMSGELRIVVATVAFGMGINKSDIRSVIHYNMPSSFESYVQEIGRAGRDGLPAHCHLFLDSQRPLGKTCCKNDFELSTHHIKKKNCFRHAGFYVDTGFTEEDDIPLRQWILTQRVEEADEDNLYHWDQNNNIYDFEEHTLNEYEEIDEELEVAEYPDDSEIVRSVMEQEQTEDFTLLLPNESDKKIEPETNVVGDSFPTVQKALEALQTVTRFVQLSLPEESDNANFLASSRIAEKKII